MGFTDKKSVVEGGSGTGLSSQQKSDSLIRQVILLQAVATVLVSVTLLLLGWVAAYSALLGGLICVIPNGYLAYRITTSGALSATQRMGRLVQGEAGKLIQTALLFGMVFALVRPLEPSIVLMSFIGIQLLHWLAPLVVKLVAKPDVKPDI